jgi:predicted ABC-type ATPase
MTGRHLAGRLSIVNSDEIARTFNPANPEACEISLRSGREALISRQQLVANQKSFVVESKFSGNQELAPIWTAEEAGYKVTRATRQRETGPIWGPTE